MKIFLLFIISGSLLLNSCVEMHKSKWIGKLDHLIEESQSWQQDLRQMQKSLFYEDLEEAWYLEERIKDKIDSLNADEAMILSDFKQSLQASIFIEERYDSTLVMIDQHLKQVKLLKTEIVKVKGRVEKYDEYIEIESNNHEKLRLRMVQLKEKYTCAKKLLLNKDKIKELIQENTLIENV